jgi:thioredoxin-related protein
MDEVLKQINLKEYNVELHNIDAQENPGFVNDYSIKAVPYFVMTDGDGNTLAVKGGMMDVNQIIDFITQGDGT